MPRSHRADNQFAMSGRLERMNGNRRSLGEIYRSSEIVHVRPRSEAIIASCRFDYYPSCC